MISVRVAEFKGIPIPYSMAMCWPRHTPNSKSSKDSPANEFHDCDIIDEYSGKFIGANEDSDKEEGFSKNFLVELWNSLEAKYMAKDASSQKFLVNNFTNYKMTNSRPLMKQYNELLDFKHTLKHKKEEQTLVELGSHVHIKESLRVQDNDKPKGNNVAGPSMVNMVEHNNSSRYTDNRGKRKHRDTKVDPNKKSKVTCWKCEKSGHLKKDCKGGKVGNKANGSGTSGLVNNSSKSLKGNKKNFLTFIDDASRFCYVYLLHTNDEALGKFKVFKTKFELQQGSQIKRFNIDRGGLKEMVNSIVFYSRLSQGFWDEAMVWGNRAVVRLPDPKLKILGERGIKCIFVGYAEHFKAFRFYVIEPNESNSINSIIESSDAIIDKNRVSSVPRPSQRSFINRTEDIGGSVVPEEVVTQQPEPKLRKSKRNRIPKNFRPEFQLYLIKGTRDEKEATNDEMDSIMGNNTWVLADLPPSCKPLGCKWIFKRKLKVDLTKEFLSSKFSMKDMGEADVIFGIRIKHEKVTEVFKETMDYSLVYTSYPSVIEGYTNASWISNTEDNSSTSDRIFLLDGGVSKEAEWLRNLILEIPLWSIPIAHISIRCDSAATLEKAYSQMYNRKSRNLGADTVAKPLSQRSFEGWDRLGNTKEPGLELTLFTSRADGLEATKLIIIIT
nr:zinc finger, CCHC-type [Tanacetum cinerariifolium]